MSVECCGKGRATRFCSDCGKKLADGPLAELLAHLRSTAQANRTRLEKTKRMAARLMPTQPGSEEDWRQAIASNQRAFDRWEGWADALAALMEGGETP